MDARGVSFALGHSCAALPCLRRWGTSAAFPFDGWRPPRWRFPLELPGAREIGTIILIIYSRKMATPRLSDKSAWYRLFANVNNVEMAC